MPACAKVGSLETSHDGFNVRSAKTGSGNVMVEGQPCHRVGDIWGQHCNPDGVCHSGVTVTGSSSVFCNGQPVARVGDKISCGSTVIATGAGSVNVGG